MRGPTAARRGRARGLTALILLASLVAVPPPATAAEGAFGGAVVMAFPFPEVWGARLPGRDDWFSEHRYLRVARKTGDIVIQYYTADVIPGTDHPRILRHYSFFSQELLFSQWFKDWDEELDSTSLRKWDDDNLGDWNESYFWSTSPWRFDPPGRVRWQGRPVIRLEREVRENRLFPGFVRSLFGRSYQLRDPQGTPIADKVFVEAFDRPTTIVDCPFAFADDDRCKDLRAIGLRFIFYPLRDGTFLGIDDDRRVVIRFDANFESPYFARDGHLMAIDTATFRSWIAEAPAKVPARREEARMEDLQAIDRYLTERVLALWRGRK